MTKSMADKQIDKINQALLRAAPQDDRFNLKRAIEAGADVDARDNIFFGRILGIEGLVPFHGESVAELKEAFHGAVTGY